MQPGAAIDPLGRHLFLDTPKLVAISRVDAPTIVYVYVLYEDHFGTYLDDPNPATWGSDLPGQPFSDFDTTRGQQHGHAARVAGARPDRPAAYDH